MQKRESGSDRGGGGGGGGVGVVRGCEPRI